MTATYASASSERSGNTALRIIGGLVLVLPALACWLTTLALPTLNTITSSFQKVNPIGNSPPKPVGGANYADIFSDPSFAQVMGFTLSFVGERLVVMAIVPLLLALALAFFGRGVRMGVRLLFTLPLALYAPVMAAVAWRIALSPNIGMFGNQPLLGDPERAGATLRLVDAFSTFGIACGVGLVVYGMALRGRGEGNPSAGELLRPLLVTWFGTLLAVAAITLPIFTPSYLLTGGGPARSTTTAGLILYQTGFQFFQFGVGSAWGTLLLAMQAALGLALFLLVVLSGLHLHTVPANMPPLRLERGGKTITAALLALLLLGALLACGFGTLPMVRAGLTSLKPPAEVFNSEAGMLPTEPTQEAYTRLAEAELSPHISLNTWLPPLLALAAQLPLDYLAALGIGGLRPLGRHSEWLLLPFAPWLFVGVLPLSIALYQTRMNLEVINTLTGMVPPILCSVPMLFLLTLFFKGQERAWRAGHGGFFQTLILPSLPLAVLLGCISVLVQGRDLFWPLLITNSQELQTASIALVTLQAQFNTDYPLLGAALVRFWLPSALGFLLVFGLFQVFFIDRLALATGNDQ